MCYSRLFMKKQKTILFVACCMMLLCGCEDKKPKYGAPMDLKIFGVTGRSDLDPGMRLGLFAEYPVEANNVPLTVETGGAVIADKELKWAFDQSVSTRFLAYAPYNESYTGKDIVEIDIPGDQSTKEKLLKCNYLVGISSGNPKESAVTMRMMHAMTAMVVSFDNRTGSRIKSMSASGFITSGRLNLITGTMSATAAKKAITPLRSPSDDNQFSFLYIPQDVTPLFTVTLESGKKIALTFDNYCHADPGNIIKMSIQLDESTPEVNILELSGVNITQWNTNGVPSAGEAPHYISLSDFGHIETDEDGFFSAYLNKVTVTAVDNTSDEFLGVIIEDSTCAKHVWTYYDSPLKVGSTVVGPVLGYMSQVSKDEYHVAYFYTTYSTIGKTGELPCTNGSFAQVVDDINKWEYRRMKFENVVLEENFSNDRAVFIQDTVRLSVVCKDIEHTLTVGTKGDLIGFPVRSGADVLIMVYDQDQFNTFSKDPLENALTADSIYGLYDLSDPDKATYVMNGADMELQYSTRIFSYGRTMQVSDTRNGEVYMFLVYDLKGAAVVGHEYNVAFCPMGISGQKGKDMYMECVKVDENTAWLVDRTGKYGLILAL